MRLDNLEMGEAKLFSRVYKWALAECERQSIAETNENIRVVLGPEVFQNIRFISLTNSEETKELGAIIWGPNGILTNEEQLVLLRRAAVGNGEVVNFNTKARHIWTYGTAQRLGLSFPIKKLSAIEMNKESDHCDFCISHRAYLVGFYFFGSISQANAKYELMVEVKIRSGNTIRASVTSKRICREPGTLMMLLLENPLVITNGTWYRILYSIKGPPSFTGDGTPKTVVYIHDFIKNQPEGGFTVDFDESVEPNSAAQLQGICFGLYK